MSGTDFYNQNQARSFPFKDLDTLRGEYSVSVGSEFLIPDSTIVDFGCYFLNGAGFDPATDHVYLYQVTRSTDTVTFEFRATASNASEYPIIFTRDITDNDYRYEFVEAGEHVQDYESSLSLGLGDRVCLELPLWEAYLVTSDMTELAILLPGNGTLTATAITDMVIEPALLEKQEETTVNSINLAVQTRFTVPDCEAVEYPDRDTYVVVATCLSGDISFKEGYNCHIRQDDDDIQLEFGSRVGAGAGEVCEDFPWYEGESSVADSQFYGGGPSCGEVVRSVNGLTGPNIIIYGGQGVNVAEHDTEENTLVVNVNFEGMTYCPD
jgi:hypothetical protein